jgi:hypothetical protein
MPSLYLRKLFAATLILLLSSVAMIAQQSQDERDADSFFHSVAATIYTLAWPTATFKKAEFSGLQRVSNGIAVVMKLSGIGLFGDDLWLKLGVVVNHDGIQDVKVMGHDALFAGPFETSKAVGQLIVELDKQYSKRQAPSAPSTVPTPLTPSTSPTPETVAAVCVVNSSNININFAYRWGSAEWSKIQLAPQNNQVYFWHYATSERISPDFEIAYDDNLADGYTEQRYNLKRVQAQTPVTCNQASQYEFLLNGNAILMQGR